MRRLLSILSLAAVGLGAREASAELKPMTRDEIIGIAKSGVGFSYWWGHGRWRLDGAQHGSCSGSCPSCSHSGSYGADCSGYVAKAWQVPGPIAVSTDAHPYSTWNFQYESTHWKAIAKGDAKKGDAFVYNSNGAGHIVIYESGDPWGSVWAYECKGCSYGCVKNLRTLGSYYAARRRNLVEDFPDKDSDGVADGKDNCPGEPNAGQNDEDKDGKGNACDGDDDGDTVGDEKDNCPLKANEGQTNSDNDGKGDACDPDDDNDGKVDEKDNCPKEKNAGQVDTDKDGKGDACDGDDDADGVTDANDNCRTVKNAGQADADGDGKGDACEVDNDDDDVLDAADNCKNIANGEQVDTDADGKGDACDSDDDADGADDALDNCTTAVNPGQEDADLDGAGDACDDDPDGDGVVPDELTTDNCPLAVNPGQEDADLDGLGDACDDDLDGDAAINDADNCATIANADQLDTDKDGDGDACEAGEAGEEGGVPEAQDVVVESTSCNHRAPGGGSGAHVALMIAGLALLRARREARRG
jgi:hypothetical protein